MIMGTKKVMINSARRRTELGRLVPQTHTAYLRSAIMAAAAAAVLRRSAAGAPPPLRNLAVLLRDQPSSILDPYSSPQYPSKTLPHEPLNPYQSSELPSLSQLLLNHKTPSTDSGDGLSNLRSFGACYPSFPFADHLDPVSEGGQDALGFGDGDLTVWADSVKKKRKKKMNKHKYRKLRKRLRRQT